VPQDEGAPREISTADRAYRAVRAFSCVNGCSLDVGVLPSAPQRPWIVILDPEAGVNLLVVVTVYEVSE